jgi:hypothetical protein
MGLISWRNTTTTYLINSEIEQNNFKDFVQVWMTVMI